MNTVSGLTRRTLLKTAHKATERFRLTVDGGVDRRLDDGEFVVDEYRFDDQTTDEPVVVYSRRLDLDQAAVLSARLQPRMAHVPQAVEPAVHIDASGHDRLSDEEFWPIVDELGGKAWEGRLAKAERALAKHDEDFVLRFAQTMAWKAHLLDHPLNFRIDHVDDGVNVVLQGDYRWLVGSVIAGGKFRWEEVRSKPGSRDPKWGSDLSFVVMHLAGAALTRQRGVRQVIVTT